MFNKIILVGNLTRDIELRYTSGGTALAKTAIATTRKFSNNGEKKEEVCFVDITFFGRSAEIANQYLRKGSKCLVEGRLMFEQWTDQQGQKRSKHSVTVETMQMLDSKGDSSNTGYSDPSDEMQPSFGGSESYNTPSSGYSKPSQPSYEAPRAKAPQQPQTPQRTPAQQPSYQPQHSLPEYDIDDDEIPF